MNITQSSLFTSVLKYIFKGYPKDSIVYKSSFDEKKIISAQFEKKTVGDKLLALDFHPLKYSDGNKKLNFDLLCKYLLESILKKIILEDVNTGTVFAEFNAHLDDFINLIHKECIEIYAENDEGEGYQITALDFRQIIKKDISFEEFGEELYSSMSIRNSPLPTFLSISEIKEDTLVQFTIKTFTKLNIHEIWVQVFMDVSQYYKNIYNTALSSTENIKSSKPKPQLKKHEINLTDFLKESSKTYQELFEQRSNQFIETTEATLIEFIELEVDFFVKCRYDLENHEASTDGYSKLGIETFSALNIVINEIGYETFHFATKRKLEFLELHKQKIIQENAIYLNFGDDISIDDDSNKLNKKQKTKKKKESLDSLTQKDFYKKVRNGKLTQLEIHHKTELLTNDFEVESLQLLYNGFDFYLFFEKEDFGSSFSDEDLLNVINDYKTKGKEIPILKIPKLIEQKDFKPLIDKKSEQIIDKEKLLFPFEFFHCYQYQNYLVNEINKFSSKLPFRDYGEYNIVGPQPKYNINYNALVNELSETFDFSVIDNILNNELHKLKKINREGYENNKGDFYDTYKSRANWVETTILICDNEYKHTHKLAFKTAIKWCEGWRERYLPLFDPYSPDEKEAMHKDLFKPLWQQLNESDQDYKGEAIKTDSLSTSKKINGDKIQLLKIQLDNYGFNKLDKMQEIIVDKTNNIYQLLIDNDLPYKIALLDYLGFLSHLQKNHCNTKDKTYSKLSEILIEDYRSVKGNCLVLNLISKENRTRYTAHNHKENVERDYQNLK